MGSLLTQKKKNIIFPLAYFIPFGGHYTLLLIILNNNLYRYTAYVTMFTRFSFVLILSYIFFVNPFKKIHVGTWLKYFFIFSLLYLARIFYAYSKDDILLHKGPVEILLFFLSFVLIPTFLISQFKIGRFYNRKIFYAILSSTFVFSLLVIIYYHSLVGNIWRFGNDTSIDDHYLNPLSLSYVGSLGLGIGFAYLYTNKVNYKNKVYIVSVIIICLFPFFLGASRGSLISLLLPILFYLWNTPHIKGKQSATIFLLILLFLLFISSLYFGTVVFDRFFGTTDDVTNHNSSAIRLDIWHETWNQYLKDPVFGNSLEATSIGFYPHNTFLEVLISVGIIGFIPYILFLYFTFQRCSLIIKQSAENYWVVVIFLQGFSQTLFSSAIYDSSDMMIGAALVFSVSVNYNKSKYYN